MISAGAYEISFDFIEIPREGPPPECETTSYARYMNYLETWTPPPAPDGSVSYIIEYSLFSNFPTVVGTGDAPEIVIDQTLPGFAQQTEDGCPVHVAVTYLCETSPAEPDVDFVSDGTARGDFIGIAEATVNSSQLTQLDLLLLMLGKDIDVNYSGSWGLIYDEIQAFLLANTDYELDFSNLEMTSTSIVNTLTNLKKLNLNNNLLGGGDISDESSGDPVGLERLALTKISMQYNLLGGVHDKKFTFMLDSLVDIDLSHNQMQEYYLFQNDNSGTPWLIDNYNLSYNFLAVGIATGARIKNILFTNNTYPEGTFWDAQTNGGQNQLDMDNFDHFEDLECFDVSDTQVKYSVTPTATDNPESHIADLRTRIEADGHTAAEALVIVKRNPKWEYTTHDPYDPNEILGD